MWVLIFIFSQWALAQQLDIQLGNTVRTYTLSTLKNKLKVYQISNLDPVYQRKKTFWAFSLNEIFELAGPIPSELDEVSFVAKDGYAPSIGVHDLSQYKGFIAFSDGNLKTGFSPAKTQYKTIDLNPFYVIWKDDPKVPSHLPRSYQLVKIQFGKFTEKFKGLFPKTVSDSSSATNGFKVFRDQCLRCHSLNGIGGTLGPELNSPNNVLEYWNSAKLKNFILNPPQFRANSQMPALGITSQQVDDILNYLEIMKDHKIAQ